MKNERHAQGLRSKRRIPSPYREEERNVLRAVDINEEHVRGF